MTDVAEWFGGRSRVLFVHAHPDDESITTGGTLAALAEAGREPLLITLTRGEQGEVVPGPLQAVAQAHGLAVVRQNELKTALSMLGLERHAFLGVPPARAEGLSPTIYEDSGMSWGEDGMATAAIVENEDSATGGDATMSADALTRVPAAEVIGDLLAGAYLSGAEAIVSYDGGGGYGHPDHVLAHQLSRAVAVGLDIPFWEICTDVAEKPGTSPIEFHDVSRWFDRKVAAIRAHVTQLRVDGDEIVHVGGQRQAIDTVEAFRLR